MKDNSPDVSDQLSSLEQKLRTSEEQNTSLQNRIDDLIEQLQERDQALKNQNGKLAKSRTQRKQSSKAAEELTTEVLKLEKKAIAADSTVAKLTAELEVARKLGDKDVAEQLEKLEAERESLISEVEDIRAATVDSWQTEKMDAAILRERLTDIAAKVAVLTAAIDGPSSQIGNLMQEATDAAKADMPANAKRPRPSGGLAERILALQTQPE